MCMASVGAALGKRASGIFGSVDDDLAALGVSESMTKVKFASTVTGNFVDAKELRSGI